MPPSDLFRAMSPGLAAAGAAVWIVSVGLMTGARGWGHGGWDPAGQIAALAFIVLMALWLWRTRPELDAHPEHGPFAPPRLAFWSMLALIVAAFAVLFAISVPLHPWLVLVTACAILSGGLIAAWRGRVTWRLTWVGSALGGLCLALAFLSGRLDGFQAFYLLCIPVIFAGGALLVSATGVGRVYLARGDWGRAAAGFLGGCALAVPAALLNVSFGAHAGDAWVDQAWEPAVALVPGIAEETWARLFLLSLVYVLLGPENDGRPGRAALAAVVIAALVHGLAHLPAEAILGPAGLQMAVSALLFGVPMGLIFVRFGFEAAVGYHTFIDFLRFWVALQGG